MKYTAIFNGHERELEVTQSDEHRYTIVIDGKSHEVDARHCGPDLLSVLMGNVSYDISFTYDRSSVLLNFRNRDFDIEVLDEQKMRMRRVQSDLELSGPEIIQTSMPGKVVKVLVEAGQQVDPGTGIIIIEAMKMENEIHCRNGGIVKSVNVTTGQTIEGGAPLVEIEPGESV